LTPKGAKVETRATIGILGGTGLYEIEGIEDISEVSLDTPFGSPSDSFILGSLEGTRIAFLSRHGRGHRLLPAEINARANIYGFKRLGVEQLISVNSVGSLKEEIKPKDFVVVDQFFDRTHRVNTFFGGGIAAHVGLAHPVCPSLSGDLKQSASRLGIRIHAGGTYLCIEGPAFSSRAESLVYRSWGCDVIGMTGATEAKLCREAEVCYSVLALVTDYDVWHEEEESVSVELVLQNLRENVSRAKSVVKQAVSLAASRRSRDCGCGEALKNAIVTNPELIPHDIREKLDLLIGKYLAGDIRAGS
jgi:5'-methylthioadenosine phosphorylase